MSITFGELQGVLSCSTFTVTWTAPSADSDHISLNILDGNEFPSLFEKLAENIKGSAQSFLWEPVNVPPGAYILQASTTSASFYSNVFTVLANSQASCKLVSQAGGTPIPDIVQGPSASIFSSISASSQSSVGSSSTRSLTTTHGNSPLSTSLTSHVSPLIQPTHSSPAIQGPSATATPAGVPSSNPTTSTTILIVVISVFLSISLLWTIFFIYKKRQELRPRPLYPKKTHFSLRIGKLFIVIGTKPNRPWDLSASSLATPSIRTTRLTIALLRSGQTTDSITPMIHTTVDNQSTIVISQERTPTDMKLV